jgi:serine phosphatase RsbU (regulator of sigma subunit)
MPQVKYRIRPHCPKLQSRFESQRVLMETQDLLLGAKGVYGALCAPPYQRIGNFDVACSTVPARHVSGDFVASFTVSGSHYVVLGDLMGKGLSAAMWLTHVLDLVHRACENGKALPEVMQSLNHEMYHSRVGVPLTSLFLMRLDPNESRISYSCGGCPPAFVLRNSGNVAKLERGGPILGAVEKAGYSAATIEFSPGETLLVASDGITELHHGMSLDEHPEQAAHHLRYTFRKSAREIVELLLGRVRQSAASAGDDLTVLAIQCTP